MWDMCYPKYEDVSLPIALECYYEDYYAETDYLMNKWPNYVKLVDISNPSLIPPAQLQNDVVAIIPPTTIHIIITSNLILNPRILSFII